MSVGDVIFFGLKILLVLALVALNGFFVAAEFALVKIRDTQLVPYIDKGHRRAKVAQQLIANLDASLSATQLGITIASLGLGWVGEPVFASIIEPAMHWLGVDSPELQHTASFVVGFSVITFLHIVVGELAPKSLAIQKPLPTSLWIARPLKWFYRASYPFIWALNNTSLWLLRRVGIEPVGEGELVHSEDELRMMIASTHQQLGTSSLCRQIVFNSMDLRQRLVREVMRPRQEIIALDTAYPMERCFEIAEKERYSRYPLCRNGNIDSTVGVVHFRDMYAMRSRIQSAAELKQVSRNLIYVPETARLEKLLQLFLERKLHFAIVVDEYGGTVGMVTLEDILEELVGEIQDEFDQEVPAVVQVGEEAWDILGSLPLHDLSELVGDTIQEEGINTTSGWVTHRLGGFPKKGDQLIVGAFCLEVIDMDGPTVARLRLFRER